MRSNILVTGLAFGATAPIGFGAVHGISNAFGASDPLKSCSNEYFALIGASEQVGDIMWEEGRKSAPDVLLANCKKSLASVKSMPTEGLAALRSGVEWMNMVAAINPDGVRSMVRSSSLSVAGSAQTSPWPGDSGATAVAFPTTAANAASDMVPTNSAQPIETVADTPPAVVPVVTAETSPDEPFVTESNANMPYGLQIEFERFPLPGLDMQDAVGAVRRSGYGECTTVLPYRYVDPATGAADYSKGVLLLCDDGNQRAVLLAKGDELFIRPLETAAPMFSEAYGHDVYDVRVGVQKIVLDIAD